jgi:hypothetical protein
MLYTYTLPACCLCRELKVQPHALRLTLQKVFNWSS